MTKFDFAAYAEAIYNDMRAAGINVTSREAVELAKIGAISALESTGQHALASEVRAITCSKEAVA